MSMCIFRLFVDSFGDRDTAHANLGHHILFSSRISSKSPVHSAERLLGTFYLKLEFLGKHASRITIVSTYSLTSTIVSYGLYAIHSNQEQQIPVQLHIPEP